MVIRFARSWWAIVVIAALSSLVLYQRWHYTRPDRDRLALQPGDGLQPLMLEDMDGKPFLLEWESAGQPTILYAFSPSCPWCARNAVSAKALADSLSSTCRFIAVSPTNKGLRAYVRDMGFQFPVFIAGSGAKALKLNVTPATFLISPGGAVMKAWLGVYSSSTLLDIESTFGIKLPAAQIPRVISE